MFSPLPLKLCVMAAMAPALTEAATQARVKIATPSSQTSQGTHHRLTNGRGTSNIQSAETSHLTSTEQVSPDKSLILSGGQAQPRGAISNLTSTRHLNGKASTQIPLTSSRQNIVNLGVVKNISGLYRPLESLGSQRSQVNGSLRTGGILMNNSPISRGGPVHTSSWAMSGGTSHSGIQAGNMGYILKSTPKNQAHTLQTSGPSAAQGAPQGGVVPPSYVSVHGLTSSLTALDPGEDTVQLGLLGDSAIVERAGVASSSGMSDVGVLTNVDLVAEATKRQRELVRSAERSMRRLRRLQSRHAVTHIQSQLNGFVDHQHKNLQSMAKSIKVPPATSMDLKTELLQSDDVKSLSTAALVSLVCRLQTSQAITLRQRLANQTQSSAESGGVLKLDEELCSEMNRVSSTLQLGVHHLENAIDSDATESSSGGESCDEMDFDYDDEKLPKVSLSRRAEWRWSMERAAVAARWTWLQAQVSDLEYRIRQQGDIYKQIRATKGSVTLGEAPIPEDLTSVRNNRTNIRSGRKLSPLEEKIANLERKNEMSPANLSTLLCNVDKQSTRLTQTLGNVYSPASSPLLTARTSGYATPKTPSTLNGFVDSGLLHSSGATPESDVESHDPRNKRPRSEPPSLSFDHSGVLPPDASCQAARCRPVRSYGKRRLLRTAGLHQLFRKAARLSTVRCHCFPPIVPCAMCGGRYNNTQTVDSVSAPMAERLALLDASYHPVLSFPQDTPLQSHFETLLKSGDWQQKTTPKPARSVNSDKRKPKVSGIDHVRKYNKKLAKSTSAAMLSSAKIRSKYEQKQLSRTHSASLPSTPKSNVSETRLCRSSEFKLKKRKAALHAIDAIRKKHRALGLETLEGRLHSTPSPPPSEMLATTNLSHSCSSSSLRELREAMRRRRGESAFDINNIVIPYSMAASTRVEKLKYKEIITPKWREINLHRLEENKFPADITKTEVETSSASQDLPAVQLPDAHILPDMVTSQIANKQQPDDDSPKLVVAEDKPINRVVFTLAETDASSELDADSSQPFNQECEDPGPADKAQGQEDEVEDMSDESIAARHLRCEIKEKKRFSSFSSIQKRSRGSRSDLGAATLDPLSPDTDTSLVTLAASSANLAPSTHALPSSPTPTLHTSTTAPSFSALTTAEDSLESRICSSSLSSSKNDDLVLPATVSGRRRTVSLAGKLRSRSVSYSEDLSHLETEIEFVAPWEPRTFPLSDAEMEALTKESETPPSVSVEGVLAEEQPDRNQVSPLNSSSASSVVEDPDDPEWTVVSAENKPVVRTGIVLKLAKR